MRLDREKLTVTLLRREMDQKQLSKLSGVSQATISAIRSGKSCSQATADKLAAVLGQEILEKEA